jgi:sec-independent protein translocase protein TatA
MVLILNDVAGSEILLILVFILIFFGSKSIPGLAQTLGRTIRQVKEASSDIQNEIKKSGAEMKKGLNLEGLIKDAAEDIRRPLDQMANDIDSTIKYQPAKRSLNVKSVQEEVVESPVAESTPDDSLKIEPIKEQDSENTDQNLA